ncbi:MAG TPA: serine/threonine-protein kinase, partial [Planctomycetia bacterium]|nr:serine/threonine-protein kinase [Planctomycetia bacterium]
MHAEPLEDPVAPSGEAALDDRDPTDALAEEFVAQLRRGERPTVDEYARKHPDHADSIRRVFPAMLLLESAVAKPRHRRQAIPDRLGDYRLKRMVGSGGMGAVYEAIQEPLGRRVAVKILAALRPDDPALPARFEREARTAARLQHPAIVPVYGVGEQDGVYFYVMQFIDGCGADVVIGQIARSRSDAGRSGGSGAATQAVAAFSARSAEREGAPDRQARDDTSTGAAATTGVADSLAPSSERYFRNVARTGAQAAGALAYAHAHGVLHRDVKPSNLLLDGRGNAFLTDFGLAKVVGDEDLTRTGVVVGTPRYMAPERLGKDPLDSIAGDIYGLGATLYELATLRPLFDDRRREALLARIRDEEPAAPRKLEPRIPRDLETVLIKAIAKDPAKRYASAAEFADDLTACAENRPIRARRQSAPAQAASWAKRHPMAATLSAALVLSLAGGLVTVSALWRRSEFHRIEANDHLIAAKNQA